MPKGVPWDSLKKTSFPAEFWSEYYTIYIYAKNNHFQAKKIQGKKITVSKWRPHNRFSFRVLSISAKIWKTAFPKRFVSEIWFIIGYHEYINIAKIKKLSHGHISVLMCKLNRFFQLIFCSLRYILNHGSMRSLQLWLVTCTVREHHDACNTTNAICNPWPCH